MSNSPPPAAKGASIVLIVAGIALVTASLAWRQFDTGSLAWSTDDAVALQQAGTRYHELSGTASPLASPDDKRALVEARDTLEALETRRESAIAAAETRKTIARWAGIWAVAAGVGLYVWANSGD